jgi:hypothetical protein
MDTTGSSETVVTLYQTSCKISVYHPEITESSPMDGEDEGAYGFHATQSFCALSKTFSGVRHSLSSQPYGRKVPVY